MGNYYRISIFGEGLETIPVLLETKKCHPREQKKRANCLPFQVESLGEGDYNGFELDGNGRFLLGDFIVTHNSTLFKLLCRFYDVTTGQIYIDGQDISKVTQESLRQCIGVVPQDTMLFNDTIQYNIGYAVGEGVPLPDIHKAAREAKINEIIEESSNGYETVVGQRGMRLSGGEKQRISIARTLLKNPPVLILDEATSSLDTKTEREIQNSLTQVAKGRTTLIIAHRLSTIVNAEQILVLKEGKIVERGTHDELLKFGKEYKSMWEAQLKEQEMK